MKKSARKKSPSRAVSVPLSFWLILILSILTLILIGTNLSSLRGASATKPPPQRGPASAGQSPRLNVEIATASPSAMPTGRQAQPRNDVQTKAVAVDLSCHYIPILMYHHVGPVQNWLYVDTATFISQMDYLVEKGYTTLSLPEILNNLRSNSWPAKPIAITFDDGYRDNFENAYSVLLSRGLKATFFIITQLAEGSEYMTWAQIKEISQNPLMTIGDHTLTHRSLNSLSEAEVKDEILSSQQILQDQTGKRIETFAYPYGSQTPINVKYLQEGNFMAAVNTEAGVSCASNPYGLRRLRIGGVPLSTYGL